LPDISTFLWVAGVLLLPAVGWAVTNHISMKSLHSKIDRLTNMQEARDADSASFKAVIQDNTRALKALTHYIRWAETQRTGQEPPPPLGDI